MADRFSSIDWDDLRVFLAIYRSGSLRGAARALGLNHATVNRRLGHLEGGLATRLFHRGPDGFALSATGEELLAPAERVEDELFGVERAIAGRDSSPTGRLKVSMPFAVMHGFLAPEIAAFSTQFPGIDLDIELTDHFSDLGRREADVSIRMTYQVTGDIVGRRLIQYAKTIYANSAVIEALAESNASIGWIGWGGDFDAHEWVRGTPFPNAPVRHFLSTHVAQIEAAKAGVGLTMPPCFLGDTEPGLMRVPGCELIADRSIWLLLHQGLQSSARIRAFIDFIAPAILRHRELLEGRGGGTTRQSVTWPA